MKKQLRLLLLTLMAVLMSGNGYAGDTYSIAFNGSNVEYKNGVKQDNLSFFSYNSDKHNFNTKFNGASYAGIDFKSGLKMEGATNVSFTSTAASTVTIVQSTWSENTIKFDGGELAVANASTGTGCRIYTVSDVKAGTHSVTRGSGESGIFYINVEYTGASISVLETPVISFNEKTGEVTITGDTNATSIVYTTDGSVPSATNGEVYEEPFIAEDGMTVNAIALGDGKNYANSAVASVTVLLAVTSVEKPVIHVVNGTFAITCATANASLKYSTDGTNYTAYTIPVTLFENATVYARASRDGITSESSAEVNAVPKGDATKTIIMTYDAFNEPTIIDGLSTMVGKDDAEGYTLVLNKADKNYSNGSRINGSNISIKLSNGAENILRVPSGYAATRITFYSYVNSSSIATVNGWKSITGVEDTQYSIVPMGATSSNPASVFDVRVFPLDGATEISFTNAGTQLCFYIVLDVMPIKPALTATYTPASLTVIKGEEFDAPVLSVTNENGEEVTGLATTYESSKEDVATVDSEGNITIVGGGKATITANIDGGDDYANAKATLELTVKSVLLVSDNPTEAVLTKEEINKHGYLAVTTDNWNNGKTYGSYSGDFYNMSKSDRQLSIIEKGAVAFEVLVQNSTAGRSYTVTIGDKESTINHGGGGIESSGIIECSKGENTITLAGDNGSVYPVAIKFYTILPIDVEIKDVGYATFYDSRSAYTIPEGVTAYVVENVTQKKVGLSPLSEVIPADCGVILEGEAGIYRLNGSAENAEAPVNLLRGSDEAVKTTGELESGSYKFYALTSSEGVVGFYYMEEDGAAFTNGAHKAYLALPASETETNFISLFETDGINQSVVSSAATDAPAYNLAGQRVGDNYRGVVIVNGMKHIRK